MTYQKSKCFYWLQVSEWVCLFEGCVCVCVWIIWWCTGCNKQMCNYKCRFLFSKWHISNMHFICAKSAAFSTHQIQPCHKTIQLWFCLCAGSEEHWPVKVNIDPVLYTTSMCWEHHFFNVSDTSPQLTQEGGGDMNCTHPPFPVFGALLLGELYSSSIPKTSDFTIGKRLCLWP